MRSRCGRTRQWHRTRPLRDVPDKESGPIIEPVRGLICIPSLRYLPISIGRLCLGLVKRRRPTAMFGHDIPERERQFLWPPLETQLLENAGNAKVQPSLLTSESNLLRYTNLQRSRRS